MHTQHLTLVT